MKNTVTGRIHSVSGYNRKKLARFSYNHAETQLDSLTGLTNKMHTQHLISQYLYDNPTSNCALFVIDVDDFKLVNDNNGHLFGDAVLASISNSIKSTFRSSDIIGRVGGDEFMVLMKEYRQISDVIDKANALRHAIHDTYAGEGNRIMSVSIGISLFKEHGDDFNTLYEKADQAMYFNKNNDKDGYTIYSPDDKSISSGGRLSSDKSSSYYTTFNQKNVNSSNVFAYELMDFTFRIMEDSKDVDNAINLLLRKVTAHYDISIIALQETTDTPYTLKYIYEYIDESVKRSPRIGRLWTFSEKEWNKTLSHYSNGYYLWQSTDDQPLDRNIMDYPGHFKTFLEIPIYSNNSFVGCIDFIDLKKNTFFTQQDISTIKMFCRIISSYLMNMRALNKTESLVEQMNAHDALTGLLKYDYFCEKLLPYMVAPRPCRIALVYSDILHFKYINETYGYAVGDELINYFVERTIEKNIAFIAATRVYSDNILCAVLVDDNMTNEEFADAVYTKNLATQEAIQEKFFNAQVSISTGIYIIEKEESILLETAVSNANTARKEAKSLPTHNCVLFDANMMNAITNNMKLSADFYSALENNEFCVYYQPKIESGTTKICGAEALIRWIKPDGKMIFPNEFIPLFESNGLIIELDYFVYKEVFKYIRERLDKNLPVVPISMNISRLHLLDDSLIDYIRMLLEEYKIPTEYLEFELTESIYIENMEKVLQLINDLSSLGIQISMDDFGSGYSSLNVLNNIPIDTLKLDRVFLSDAILNDKQLIILASIIEMAKKLHISVLCEGVEYLSQCDMLYKLGCNIFQGYYYSRPLSQEAFDKYIEEHFVCKANSICFPFDNSFEDSSNTHIATFNGDGYKFCDGPFKDMGALHFSGGTAGTNVLDIPLDSFPIADFTVSMWIMLDEVSNMSALFFAMFNKGFCSLLPHSIDGRPSFRMYVDSDDAWFETSAQTNLVPDVWYHITATYDTKHGVSRLFLNGEQLGFRIGLPFLNTPLRIILGGDIYQDSFRGRISDFKIFDQALSSNDVLKEYVTYKKIV